MIYSDLKFCWSQKPYKYDPSESLYELHALRVTSLNGQAPLDGSVITSDEAIGGPRRSDVRLDIRMNDEGAVHCATGWMRFKVTTKRKLTELTNWLNEY